MIQHLADAERVFVYRAMRFSRKDTEPLPGFDEDSYAANANAANRSFDSLVEEFGLLRKSTDLFLGTLTEEQLSQAGVANNKPITVNAIAFIVYGHILHHKQVIEERYL